MIHVAVKALVGFRTAIIRKQKLARLMHASRYCWMHTAKRVKNYIEVSIVSPETLTLAISERPVMPMESAEQVLMPHEFHSATVKKVINGYSPPS